MTDDIRSSVDPSSPLASSRVKRLPELTQTAMWVTAIVIAALTAAAVVALWWPATAGLNGADLVKARLDALKIGLSVGVGSGGVVALYLAWRRQHSAEADLDNRERALAQQYEVLAHQQAVATTTQAHQERVAEDARADATARRITELYLKAIEQLGSDKSPVRLGGLYALERLAQDNGNQRQTIVNVLCAYLRMPYQVPGNLPAVNAEPGKREEHRAQVEELEVRRTAQRLLAAHLASNAGSAYWGELNLDLADAQLIDFTLADARIGSVSFDRATFTNDAFFIGVTFTRSASFNGATFSGIASFYGATVAASFFLGATMSAAVFARTTFTEPVMFSGATVGYGSFEGATFKDFAQFDNVTFDTASFDKATFSEDVSFVEVAFKREAKFQDIKFARSPSFEGATLGGAPFSLCETTGHDRKVTDE